jgi:hypothetical protein
MILFALRLRYLVGLAGLRFNGLGKAAAISADCLLVSLFAERLK